MLNLEIGRTYIDEEGYKIMIIHKNQSGIFTGQPSKVPFIREYDKNGINQLSGLQKRGMDITTDLMREKL